MNVTLKNMLVVLLLVMGSMHTHAQFNPTNPPDPQENIYHNITVVSNPAAAAYTYGSGKFLEGSTTTVRYSLRNSNYRFTHWTLNGERYSESSSFAYTVGSEKAEFVAHFEYLPPSPQDPSVSDEYRLHLMSDKEEACSFNITSGERHLMDNYVQLTVYVNQGYEFLGWYKNGVLVSENTTFNYLMPGNDVTLTAMFRYNPTSPGDPESDGSQSNVQTTPTGDVNKDGKVNILDIVAVVNYSLGESDENLSAYDVNCDGNVNILDIVMVVNKSLE